MHGPGDDEHDFFGEGPVVGLLVDDFQATRAAMEAVGVEFLGDPQVAAGATWNHDRGPDGNVYEIVARSAPPAPAGPVLVPGHHDHGRSDRDHG